MDKKILIQKVIAKNLEPFDNKFENEVLNLIRKYRQNGTVQTNADKGRIEVTGESYLAGIVFTFSPNESMVYMKINDKLRMRTDSVENLEDAIKATVEFAKKLYNLKS